MLLIISTVGQLYNMMCKSAIEVDPSVNKEQAVSLKVVNSLLPITAGVLIDIFGINRCVLLFPLPMVLSSALMFTRPTRKDSTELDDIVEPMFQIGSMAMLVG